MNTRLIKQMLREIERDTVHLYLQDPCKEIRLAGKAWVQNRINYLRFEIKRLQARIAFAPTKIGCELKNNIIPVPVVWHISEDLKRTYYLDREIFEKTLSRRFPYYDFSNSDLLFENRRTRKKIFLCSKMTFLQDHILDYMIEDQYLCYVGKLKLKNHDIFSKVKRARITLSNQQVIYFKFVIYEDPNCKLDFTIQKKL